MFPVLDFVYVSTTVMGGLLFALFLGLIHGATPDEHTWPITLSYSLGSGSILGGALAGLLFSLGFTIQRALLSELSYLVLAPFLLKSSLNGVVYIIVGLLMAVAGSYILRKGVNVHVADVPRYIIHDLHDIYHYIVKRQRRPGSTDVEHKLEEPRPVPLKLAIVHGLVAGFAFDAFAIVVFTTIVAQMPNAYLGWLPGAMFGVGTMIMQILFGSLVALFLRTRRYTQKQIAYIGRKTAGRVLAYAGLGFILIGSLLFAVPSIDNFGVPTGIPIPNLDTIDLGFLLIMSVLFIVAVPCYFIALKEVRKLGKDWEKKAAA